MATWPAEQQPFLSSKASRSSVGLTGSLIKWMPPSQGQSGRGLKPVSLLPQPITEVSGPGSSVGIATDYGLDGPGSNPGVDEIFCTLRPALGPSQPPVKWVPDLSRG